MTEIDFQPLYAKMNKKFTTLSELKQNKREVSQDPTLRTLEEIWVQTYFQPIVEFMGTDEILEGIFHAKKSNVNDDMFEIKSGSPRETSITANRLEKYMLFKPRGTEGHYRARLPDSVWKTTVSNTNPNQFFDSYNHYQIHGSNQFCQTYALMYLLGILPFNNAQLTNSQFPQFYNYTKKAIDFIDYALKTYYGTTTPYLKEMRKCINVLKKYPSMCLNCPE